MNLNRAFRIAAMLGMTAVSITNFAADSGTFRNGQSLYGQPSRGAANARVVDVGNITSISVAYGETVTFRSEGAQFSWTFDGLDRRAIDIAKIAPAGFVAKPMEVYVGRSPANRR